jgi:hypothetical protein
MSEKFADGRECCEPPQGTLKYTGKHGFSFARTGAVSVCSNLWAFVDRAVWIASNQCLNRVLRL